MGVKKQLFITVDFQPINVEEMMEREKLQFGRHHSNDCWRQSHLYMLKLVEESMMGNRIFV